MAMIPLVAGHTIDDTFVLGFLVQEKWNLNGVDVAFS